MTITKTDEAEWKSSQVTKAFLSAITERVYEIHTEIAESVTKPLDEIRFRQGYVQAMKDMLQMEFLEELEE